MEACAGGLLQWREVAQAPGFVIPARITSPGRATLFLSGVRASACRSSPRGPRGRNSDRVGAHSGRRCRRREKWVSGERRHLPIPPLTAPSLPGGESSRSTSTPGYCWLDRLLLSSLLQTSLSASQRCGAGTSATRCHADPAPQPRRGPIRAAAGRSGGHRPAPRGGTAPGWDSPPRAVRSPSR